MKKWRFRRSTNLQRKVNKPIPLCCSLVLFVLICRFGSINSALVWPILEFARMILIGSLKTGVSLTEKALQIGSPAVCTAIVEACTPENPLRDRIMVFFSDDIVICPILIYPFFHLIETWLRRLTQNDLLWLLLYAFRVRWFCRFY